MREILFKGKSLDNGKWVEGFYLQMSETNENYQVTTNHYISYMGTEPGIFSRRMYTRSFPKWLIHKAVDPETICQYTGLKDKNGEKIWENDIVKFINDEGDESFYKVSMIDGKWCTTYKNDFPEPLCNDNYQLICAGNVFDNSELLKEE